MMAHTIYNDYWNRDRGNETRILEYPLNQDSWIIELGGYEGWFTEKAYNKFKCNILSVEPIFYDTLINKFKNFDKIRIECCGISDEEKEIDLFIDGDATSNYSKVSDNIKKIICHPIEYFIEKYNIEKINLVQINIEGEEYSLLEKWISSDILNRIQYIQVQYHDFVPNYIDRKKNIEKGLIDRDFENLWDYDIVFSSWVNKNFK